ncbi:BTB domain and ankyrin repeat protein [Aspergillus steynii IBT 23096]|uniref:BTB domain and ankyrin repeat protein n=1 Tax=Aspergillus steynii IBT 23096 TaxID=1392250 RepID=A0A2I2GRY6_9EURO|nr:BTB domain and ankyrin repeat protein [Aspergillus steynii IBT 23096]PLB55623.1 BTB domain and ankyrin repeat protein [Aspergillus steynii IBT 23096]
MSSKLWEFFLRDDVQNFQRFLATASYTSGGQRTPGSGGPSSFKIGSSGTLTGSSPGLSSKGKKLTGTSPGTPILERGASSRPGKTLSREELNARDQHGRTLLHHVVSSTKSSSVQFALSLLEVPFLDIYVQDWESGWTALHRALYAGNVTIAQALIARDMRDATDFSKQGTSAHVGGLIKIKDREGNSPFDVYGATITSRDIKQAVSPAAQDSIFVDEDQSDVATTTSSEVDDSDDEGHIGRGLLKPRTNLLADEVFTFGSNKNLNLGVGDQDDRQFPERIALTRPPHLLQRFYRDYQKKKLDRDSSEFHHEQNHHADLPALIKNKSIRIQDIAMSKLHTAILTNDPESNLFLCGFGPGGRLGTGDESTRFGFVCIETGGLANRKVVAIALGQDHSLAITDNGGVFSWGSNKYGQLGYGLPRTNNKDDVPIQDSPRQIFNPFKKEIILGAAASAIHSVVFSHSGLYTFGKNEGQLGLVDSDARSLETQTTPRRVGASLFSAVIQSVSAIDHATAVLLQNHEVWVFSQYGYSRLSFPLDVSSSFIKNSFMATRYDTSANHIAKIRSGGNTICALSSSGDVFTVQVNKTENPSALTSTTNPAKIRNSLSQPSRVWSVKKAHLAVRDVDVGQDGSIIICTANGSAWRKEKRRKAKDGSSKDYKFARIPGLSRVVGVCSNAFGAYVVAQRDCDVTKEQINIDLSTLSNDLLPISPFSSLLSATDETRSVSTEDGPPGLDSVMSIKAALMSASDLEAVIRPLQYETSPGMVWLKTTRSDVQIPVHEFVLSGRSSVWRKAFHEFRLAGSFSIPDVLDVQHDNGHTKVLFHGIDILTVLNVAFFSYTDAALDAWQQARHTPESASRYRQVRIEVMRIATVLDLPTLERAARLMIEPVKSLKSDMALAILDPSFFESSDVIVELNGDTMKVHSEIICQRCPFFDALFNGRSGGRWLASRRENSTGNINVDLKHIERPIFEFVLRYLYADTEEEMFDEVRTRDLEDFIDLVLDVAFVANELMIDRLAQICQKMLGRFVNARNVCHFLNSVAPCYVPEFKDAALEYICLNLEDLLANRSLLDLDEHLLRALDHVCHENQLTSYPVSRGRNSEEFVFEKYPELVSEIESDKRRRIDSVRLRSHINRIEALEGKLRAVNLDKTAESPLAQKAKSAQSGDNLAVASPSPSLRPKQSSNDLMFQMDDDSLLSPGDAVKGKATVHGNRQTDANEGFRGFNPSTPRSGMVEAESFGDQNYLDGQMATSQDTILGESPTENRAAAAKNKGNGIPLATSSQGAWTSSDLSASKKNLKDIMSEASETRVSNLSLGMSDRRESSSNFAPKLSQKERKKIQQQQMQDMLTAQQKAKEAPQNPWKVPTPSKTPSKPSPFAGINGEGSPSSEAAKLAQKPSMTLRQTVAGTPPTPRDSPAATTPVQIQSRSASASAGPPQPRPSISGPSAAPVSSSPNPSVNTQPAVQSIRHTPRPEPYKTSFHSDSPSSMSLAAILMQQQTEKDEIREAATAKHNLEDIQAEQQFQEWWDKESRRIQGIPDPEETPTPQQGDTRGGGGGGRGGRGKGPSGQQRKRRGKPTPTPPSTTPAGTSSPGISALSQQLPRPPQPVASSQKQKPPSGPRRDTQPRSSSNGNPSESTTQTGNHPRRGGRGGAGGARGRGKDRADRHSNNRQPAPTTST